MEMVDIFDRTSEDVFETVALRDENNIVIQILTGFSDREKYIIVEHLKGKTFLAISKTLPISAGYTNQIYNVAINRLLKLIGEFDICI